jgi:putative transposase
MLIRDMDSKFSKQFDDTFAVNSIRVIKVGPKMPNKNAHMERWIQSFEFEALNHFIVFGEKQLTYITNAYVAWYNSVRPHQGLENLPLTGPTLAIPPEDWRSEDVVIDEALGGVLHHCRWKAAA